MAMVVIGVKNVVALLTLEAQIYRLAFCTTFKHFPAYFANARDWVILVKAEGAVDWRVGAGQAMVVSLPTR